MQDPKLDQFRSYLYLLARINIRDENAKRLEPSDIVQQTLLEAHRDLAQFRGSSEAELAGWLRQILARTIIEAQRTAHRDKRDVRRELALEGMIDASSQQLGAWLADDASSPSHKADRHEQAMRLADALLELPEAQRQALILQTWQGLTLSQIGEELGKTPVAVAGLLKRGLKRLREILADPDNSRAQPENE